MMVKIEMFFLHNLISKVSFFRALEAHRKFHFNYFYKIGGIKGINIFRWVFFGEKWKA
jgi:hypothetical protein